MVKLVFGGSYFLAFLATPVYFVQGRNYLVRNGGFDKFLYRLDASFQGRGVDFIELNMFVSIEKGCGLQFSERIKGSVYAGALHDLLPVKIRFAVADEVNFFRSQWFVLYFCRRPKLHVWPYVIRFLFLPYGFLVLAGLKPHPKPLSTREGLKLSLRQIGLLIV